MPYKIRGHINDDDFQTANMMRGFKPNLEVSRMSQKVEKEAIKAFIAALSNTVPMGPKARGFLEVSGNTGNQVLMRVVGKVTTTRLGRDGHSRVPDGGIWTLENGDIVARTSKG